MSQSDNIDERTPLLPSSSLSTSASDLSDAVTVIPESGTGPVPGVTEQETPRTPDDDQGENATRVSPVVVVAVLTIVQAVLDF